MSEPRTPGERPTTVESSEINWSGIFFGGLLLALLVAVVEPVIPRVVAAVAALAITFYIGQAREEQSVETPLLNQIQESRPGLDRRKYGRLRKATNELLSGIRQLNRIAVDARSGKITHRHANAELERIATHMKKMVDQARKAAGIPSPTEERQRESAGGGPSEPPDTPVGGDGGASGAGPTR